MKQDRTNAALDILKQFSEGLDSINQVRENEKPFYELMSGALVWSDETTPDTPFEVISALRFVWAYRTSLMLNKPRIEFEELWESAQKLFPNWIGFLPERRSSTPNLIKIFRDGDVSLRACLRKMYNTDE